MPNLGGGFNDSLFLPLPGKMIQVHEHSFQMGWFNHQLETGKSRNTSNNNLSNEHGTPKRPPNSNCNFRLHHCSLWRSSPGSQQKPTTPGLVGDDIVGFLSIFLFCIPWMWRFRSRDPLFSNGCRLLVNSNTIGCNCYFGISIMQVDLWPFLEWWVHVPL